MVIFGFYALTILMIFAPIAWVYRFSTIETEDKRRLIKSYLIWSPLWFAYALFVSSMGFLDGFEMPPKLPLLIIFPMIINIVVFNKMLTPFLDKLSVSFGIYIQTFRILVELLIFGGFVNGLFPKLLTFQGHNMDILVGISASIVAVLYQKFALSRKALLAWNIVSLAVLAHTIGTFVRSFYFLNSFTEEVALQFVRMPYLLLPAFLAPMAIFFHTVSIRQLLKKE